MIERRRTQAGSALFDVERLGSGRLARGIEGDLLDPGLGLAQQLDAAALERFAALVDRDRLLERHLALLEPLDDRFELLDRLLEGQPRDVGVFGHDPLSDDNRQSDPTSRAALPLRLPGAASKARQAPTRSTRPTRCPSRRSTFAAVICDTRGWNVVILISLQCRATSSRSAATLSNQSILLSLIVAMTYSR